MNLFQFGVLHTKGRIDRIEEGLVMRES